MLDLDTLFEPLLEGVPAPKPLRVVRARADAVRRRGRTRRRTTALVAVAAVATGAVALGVHDRHTTVTVVHPAERLGPGLDIGTPLRIQVTALDMIDAFGSIWVSQPDRVVRLDPQTGRVEATIAWPGTSDIRNLASGAGSLWIDDPATRKVARIDPVRNAVVRSIVLDARPHVTDGLAFIDGKLWIARPEPQGDARGDVIAIDPSTYRIAVRTAIPRTFTMMAAGEHSLWYTRGSDLLRFDTHSLRVTTVRHDATAVLAVSGPDLWVWTSRGVIQVDGNTGAQLGHPIVPTGTSNVTVAVSGDVVWIGAQPDSSSRGAVTPYSVSTRRALALPTRVGLPILGMEVVGNAVWVDAGGLTRIPFRRL